MKNILWAIVLLFSFNSLAAQNLYNKPESAIYDVVGNRYLISNYANGAIVQRDNLGVQTYFHNPNQGLTSLAGLELVGDTVYTLSYLGENPGLIGFNLANGDSMVVNLYIEGMDYLNDITSDSSGNVYITETYENKIFKVRLSDLEVTTIVSSGLNQPDGIFFDEPNNRLLVLNAGYDTGPIMAVDLEDFTMSTATETGIAGLDGITVDNEGNFYLSSWYTDKVYRYDSNFNNRVDIASGYTAPGDIYFNGYDNILVVPDFFTHTVDYIPIAPISIVGNGRSKTQFELSGNYPNPFFGSTTISYTISDPSVVTMSIYNGIGQIVRAIETSHTTAGSYTMTWNGRNNNDQPVATGMYFYELEAGNQKQAQRMLLIH